jgi:secondary thiamine-phosphate synthase enzyme
MTEIFELETQQAQESLDLTSRVREIVKRAGVVRGLCQVMVLHSTCAVVVNETADPNIGRDVLDALGRAVPEKGDWLHDRIDDNAAAHIKASLLGPSELLPIDGGELLLGTWQGIWLFEFDGPRRRRVAVHVLAG